MRALAASTRGRLPVAGQDGFTLIEMVAAIVIMSILSIGLVSFITDSAEGYVQTATRNQISAAGRVVIDRIAMELRNAVPQSVRVTTPKTTTDIYGYSGDQCLEFIPVTAATTYINPAFRPAARKTTFNVINLVPNQVGATGRYAVIYPTSAADLYAASFAGNTTEAIAGVSSVLDANTGDGIQEITTSTNHRFKRTSPVERLFLTTQPVSYCLSGPKLYRYTNYGFNATQRIPVGPAGACATTCLPAATPDRVLITDQLDNASMIGGGSGQAFDNLAANRRRNGVVQLDLNFAADGQVVRLNHEVMLQVTP